MERPAHGPFSRRLPSARSPSRPQCARAEGKTAGGVLLTTETDKPTFGEVVAVGSGKKDGDGKVTAPNVKVGATVMYSKYSGTEFEEGDDAFIVIRESDVLCELA
jgi:chaperonin GroES